MFPSELFSLFPPFPRNQHVFVAMSFDPVFKHRWEVVIEPTIQGLGLKPIRVDASTISDSILTQILRGISDSRLIFADITAVTGLRNPNVMYEIGLAHAVRQPQEVLLFRSDDDPLDFDVAHVKVNSYAPDTDVTNSKATVKKALTEAMSEVEQRKGIAVDKTTDALDPIALNLMLDAREDGNGVIHYPRLKTMRDFLINVPKILALSRLLELGVVKAKYPTFTLEDEDLKGGKMDIPLNEAMKYELTLLGHAVMANFATKLGDSANTQ